MPPPTTRPNAAGGARLDVGERVLAGAIALACFGVLGAAWWIVPDASGIGTHRQLGLPACGWMQSFGRPCMTCGMTTAFSHMAHASPLASFKAQPLGAVLALLAAVAGWLALFATISGARMDRIAIAWLRPRVLWIFAGCVLAAWVYKIAVTPVATLG